MRTTFCTIVFCFIASAAHADPKAEEILKKADAIRNPSETYKMSVMVRTKESRQKFEVAMSGPEKTVIIAKEPARDVGRNMLMLERDFYAYVPNLKRAVRLSLAQKLSGQVSNGDIARTRWYGDYTAEVIKANPQETELFLSGKKPNLTYQKMRLWVDTSNFRPLRAEYYSLDGKTLLKKAVFEGYKSMAGALRPSLMNISDATGAKSTMEIQSMSAAKLDDSYFTQRNLETLR